LYKLLLFTTARPVASESHGFLLTVTSLWNNLCEFFLQNILFIQAVNLLGKKKEIKKKKKIMDLFQKLILLSFTNAIYVILISEQVFAANHTFPRKDASELMDSYLIPFRLLL